MSTMDSGGPPIPAGAPENAVKGPAIGLIVVAILGLLGALVGVVNTLLAKPADIMKQAQAQNPNMNEQQTEMAAKIAEYATKGGTAYYVVLLIVSLVVLFGAIQMLKLRSYGLAMTGSVLSLVPCISPCCVLGIPFGIWSLIVLMRPEVKQAFH